MSDWNHCKLIFDFSFALKWHRETKTEKYIAWDRYIRSKSIWKLRFLFRQLSFTLNKFHRKSFSNSFLCTLVSLSLPFNHLVATSDSTKCKCNEIVFFKHKNHIAKGMNEQKRNSLIFLSEKLSIRLVWSRKKLTWMLKWLTYLKSESFYFREEDKVRKKCLRPQSPASAIISINITTFSVEF